MRTDIEPEGIPTEMPLAAIKIETVEDYGKATVRVPSFPGMSRRARKSWS